VQVRVAEYRIHHLCKQIIQPIENEQKSLKKMPIDQEHVELGMKKPYAQEQIDRYHLSERQPYCQT
jgi:hypothetical protein